MKIKEAKKSKISFPLGLYFQQLVFPDTYVKFINPFSFWRRYRINHLEDSWEFDIVQHLERSHQTEWQPVHSQQDLESIKNLLQTGTYRGVPWEKKPQNTILISQPSLELKYRGVTYRTNGIVAINANKVKIEPGSVTSNNSEKINPGSNNSNISKTSSNI